MSGRKRRRLMASWKIALLVVAAAVFAFAGYVALHKDAPPTTAGQSPGYTTEPTPAPLVAATLHPLTGRNVMFLGDSWSTGFGASDPATKSWIPLVCKALNWQPMIFAYGGAGFLRPPSKQLADVTLLNKARTVQPLKIPDLVVLQGGSNDRLQPYVQVNRAFGDTISALHRRFPNAQILVVGPMSSSAEHGAADINYDLHEYALIHHVPYLDGEVEHWVPPLAGMFDPRRQYHPTDAGYAAVARHFVADVRDMLRAS